MKKRSSGIIGLQTGDEGKGARVAYIARRAVEQFSEPVRDNKKSVLVVRYQGGGNAGHTVVTGGVTYKLHQVPSGILVPETFNFVGEGVYLDPIQAVKEVDDLRKKGITVTPHNFGIASNTHVTMGYHIEEDKADFEKTKHTSTGRGIQPTAVDKYGKCGIRFEEFLDRDLFFDLMKEKKKRGRIPDDLEGFVSGYDKAREFLKSFSVLQTDVFRLQGRHYVVWEGAQGFRLDVTRGLYPGVTSSEPVVIPQRVDTIYGVVKLYESSVGSDRPFVSRIEKNLERELRDKFNEFGATTGKPRDLGWFDVVAVKHAIESSETDYLIGNCCDRLSCLSELKVDVKLVVGYEINGRVFNSWHKSFHNRTVLYYAKPILEEFKPWERLVDDNGEVTENARRYLDRIQELTGKKFAFIGVGPSVDEVIEIRDIFAQID